jgi:hypothetical protein
MSLSASEKLPNESVIALFDCSERAVRSNVLLRFASTQVNTVTFGLNPVPETVSDAPPPNVVPSTQVVKHVTVSVGLAAKASCPVSIDEARSIGIRAVLRNARNARVRRGELIRRVGGVRYITIEPQSPAADKHATIQLVGLILAAVDLGIKLRSS